MENNYRQIDCIKCRIPLDELANVCIVTKSITLKDISIKEIHQLDELSLLNFEVDLKFNDAVLQTNHLVNATIQASGIDRHGISTFSLAVNFSDDKNPETFWQSILSPRGTCESTHWIDLLVVTCESKKQLHRKA